MVSSVTALCAVAAALAVMDGSVPSKIAHGARSVSCQQASSHHRRHPSSTLSGIHRCLLDHLCLGRDG